MSEGRQKETGALRSPGTRGTATEAMVTGTGWTVPENGGIVEGAQTGGGRKVAVTDQTMTEAEHHLATEVGSEAGKGIDTGRADGLCLVKGNTEKTTRDQGVVRAVGTGSDLVGKRRRRGRGGQRARAQVEIRTTLL